MQDLQLPKDCSQLIQIGKSNNSHIYKGLNKQGEALPFALKLIVHQQKGVHCKECFHLKNEEQILGAVNHEGIVKISGLIQDSVCLKGAEFCALMIELADSDLFDLMSSIYPKVLSPDQIRVFFRKINSALELLHNSGFAHNDLKLENILLYKNKSEAKIADFGFASSVSTTDSSAQEQKNKWANRCKTMLAPEILSMIKSNQNRNEILDEKKSDVFALGVTLFQSLFLRTPFASDHASIQDSLFKYFYSGKTENFWKQDEITSVLNFINKQNNFREEQFKDLINNMFQVNPKNRYTIQQVISHPWFN